MAHLAAAPPPKPPSPRRPDSPRPRLGTASAVMSASLLGDARAPPVSSPCSRPVAGLFASPTTPPLRLSRSASRPAFLVSSSGSSPACAAAAAPSPPAPLRRSARLLGRPPSPLPSLPEHSYDADASSPRASPGPLRRSARLASQKPRDQGKPSPPLHSSPLPSSPLRPFPARGLTQAGLPDLAAEQDKDDTIRSLRARILSHSASPREGRKFQILNDAVYTRSSPPQAYAPSHLRNALLHEANCSILTGHGAFRKTADRLGSYYWPSKLSMIKAYTSSCDNCQRFKSKNRKEGVQSPLEPRFPMHIITLDAQCLPKSQEGFAFLYVFVETFTKFIHCVPAKTLGADEACTALQDFIFTYGLFYVLITDFASSFTSAIFKNLTASLGIKISYAPIYFHNYSGSSEILIREVKNKLALLCEEVYDQWPRLIKPISLAFNFCKRFSLNCSPFELMYGFPALLGANILGHLPQTKTRPQKLLDHFALRTNAWQHIARAHAEQKYYFERARLNPSYKKGDKVLIFRKRRRLVKYFWAWLGPFTVRRQSGPSSYIVRVLSRGKLKDLKYHITHMKHYVPRPAYLDLGPPAPQLPCLSAAPSTPLPSPPALP